MATLSESRFRHEAVFYRDLDEFLRGTTPFVEAGLENEQAVMVAVSRSKTEALRERLGAASTQVEFAEMESLGANPARIISAWKDFAQSNPDRSLRGIGEPAWSGRDSDELVECNHHEMLLNLALSKHDLWLLCPYDAANLDAETLELARRNHPYLSGFGGNRESAEYVEPQRRPNPLHESLSSPPERATVLDFKAGQMGDIRNYILQRARRVGMHERRAADLALAIHELATNSVDHGGGGGSLLVWSDEHHFSCQVRDRGQITDPLVGRTRVSRTARGGRGVWLVHQLCDFVQVRALEGGNVVRVRMAIDPDRS